MPRRPAHRPTKFTRETVELLLAGIRAGLPYHLAADAAGVSRSTFNEWQAGQFPRGADPQLKLDSSDALTRAKGQSALRLMATINRAAPTDWRAAAWILERRFPDDFGKRLEVTGEDGGPIRLQVDAVQRAVITALAAYPDARLAVADALASLEGGDADHDAA
jgi:hypothetical protein